jgi:peroxiredoxin
VAAAAGAVALDQFSLARKESSAWPADPSLLTPPDLASWGASPLTLGGPAADFNLQDVRTGTRVSLNQLRGRPVVLLLSSFGCNVFCRELGRLTDLHKAFQDDATFVFIAIRDAGHPDPDTSPPQSAPRPGESDLETRRRRIREGAEYLSLPFPVLFDADGEAERAYAAFPKRLIVIGADGRIVYDGGRGAKRGPSDWDLIEVEQHLRTAISEANGG